ncbi:MAG: IS1634 family transposase, partial [Burkholderiales bacterium]
MFIRRTQTRSRASGEPYTTHRLVQTARAGSAVKQTTLLNLGSHFDLPQQQWPGLAQRIDELFRGQSSLLDPTLSDAGQALAQRYAAQLIALQPSAASITAAAAAKPEPSEPGRFQEVDLDSLDLVRPRSVGVEHAALSAMRQCGLEDKLAELGLNRPQIAAAVGNIVGRMAHPGSELATHAWLQQRSALGELIGLDFEAMDLNRLYRASDALYKHREALQEHLFGQAQSIFGFGETITLYDLTNTYFEGVAAGVGKAKRGHSKECRSDCPLVTLAMALDGSGFPRRSRVFAGNASEPATLAEMLTGLGAPSGATVVMDAGIATEANLTWLRAQGYHYVVVSRLRERQFDPALATEVQSAGEVTIRIQRVLDEQGHALLYCHSPAREQKDRAIDAAKAAGFEAVLGKLQAGLSKPRGTKDVATIMERLGRAKQRFSRAAQHYQVEVAKDDTGTQVRAITWSKRLKPGSAAAHPGVYCLRTTLVELDDATLWRTYTMLTNLEAVFRSLKTDLGLRPVFHQI